MIKLINAIIAVIQILLGIGFIGDKKTIVALHPCRTLRMGGDAAQADADKIEYVVGGQ